MQAKYTFTEIEKDMLSFWEKQQTYANLKAKNAKGKDFYFLDGPPYTSGRVHIGTAWNKSLKDSLLRYKRMQGFNVFDRAGYDMHGLPTENATQKKLGLQNKEDIEKFGKDKFIEECKQLCIDNMKLMNADFQNMGVWMDFEGAYQSITRDYMSGEWWLIKRANEEGRLYEGLRTMTWCPITESALAKHELEYKTVTDTSIFVKFKITSKEWDDNTYLVIWTTTPWTIPFNLAVMVNPEVEYVKAKVDGEIWIVANALANVFISSVADKTFEILETFAGDKLEGVTYVHPLQDELGEHYNRIKAEAPKTHTVLLSEEFVDTSGGSGLVHCAPGCGAEDYEVGHRNGIPPFNTTDPKGVYDDTMGKFSGWIAKTDDKKFIEAIDETGALIAKTPIEHEYPHDWRYHSPVIFRTTKQWFFKIEDIKEKMIADNNKIEWVPQTAFNAFDSWLKHLRDNSISKQRFWGTPVPIWRNVDDETDYIVVGSVDELEELSGQKIEDLHISTVDKITFEKDCKKYARIPDVLDVWVDAGVASWNALDFPRKTDLFDRLFPADFILEGKDQIRGWFNLLMIASTLAHGKPSFKNVYMHGFIQDAQGRKMSKSLGNYILPEEVIEKYGADTLRYYMIGGANPAMDLNYNFDDVQTKHRSIGILWNMHNFILDSLKSNGLQGNDVDFSSVDNSTFSVQDKYILSQLQTTTQKMSDAFDHYRLNEPPQYAEELYLELSRFYIQLVRDTLALGSTDEKKRVLAVIVKIYVDSLKLLAPIIPFVTEKIFQNMREVFSFTEESIHHCSWPTVDETLKAPELESYVAVAKNIIQGILNGREKVGYGVRWPLPEVILQTADENVVAAVSELSDLICSQTNIKKLTVVETVDYVKESFIVEFKKLGPDFGEKAVGIVKALPAKNQDEVLSAIHENGEYSLDVDGETFAIKAEHLTIKREVSSPFVEIAARKGYLYMHGELTPELLAEGYARELMRRIQSKRKDAGLSKVDRIDLVVEAGDYADALNVHVDMIKEKVGASECLITSATETKTFASMSEEKIKGKVFVVKFDTL